ncbi:MAG: hypothetical protein KGY50_05275 [Candidatus Thermoplasmatota archaeon]|nr:hypothetical protein [Candidatus Thermoplasmatota archaeon]
MFENEINYTPKIQKPLSNLNAKLAKEYHEEFKRRYEACKNDYLQKFPNANKFYFFNSILHDILKDEEAKIFGFSCEEDKIPINEKWTDIEVIELQPEKPGHVCLNDVTIHQTPNGLYTFSISVNLQSSGYGEHPNLHNGIFDTANEAKKAGLMYLKSKIKDMARNADYKTKATNTYASKLIHEIDGLLSQISQYSLF